MPGAITSFHKARRNNELNVKIVPVDICALLYAVVSFRLTIPFSARGHLMEQRVAIVTGGLRGLGRAMVFGLAREGHYVVAVGHIDADVAEVEAETAGTMPEGQILPTRTRSIMTISTERASTIWRKGTMPQTYSPPATGVASGAAMRARPG